MVDYNIVYFAFVSSNYGGVEQKILAQFDALKKIHFKTFLFLVSSIYPKGSFKLEVEKREDINLIINTPAKVKNPFKRRNEKMELIYKAIEKYKSIETIVFFRFPGADFYSNKLFSQLKNRGYKIITEHQQIENPYRIRKFVQGYFLISLLDLIYGKRVRHKIDGFVNVCSDIAKYEQAYFKQSEGKLMLTIGNGILIADDHSKRNSLIFNQKELKIIFVGGGYKTQGLHRIIRSLNEYYKGGGEVKVLVHVVGDSSEMAFNKKLINRFNLNEYFIFHGNLNKADYNYIFDECHLAMGTISFSRIGLYSHSTLKNREYCVKGIPFFYAGNDEDFSDEFEYHLKLQDDDKIFDINLLIDFALRMNKLENKSILMRKYAEENLSWNVKMKKYLNFFNNVFYSN